MKKCATIWIFPFLMIFGGCSTTQKPEPLIQIEYIRERPPAELLRPCPAPATVPVVITADLITNWLATREAYETCAAAMDALIQWYSTQ